MLTTSAPSITTDTISYMWLFHLTVLLSPKPGRWTPKWECPTWNSPSPRALKQPHKGWDWDKLDTRWEIPFPNIVQNIFATVLCNLNLDLYGLPSLQQTFTLTHTGEDMRGIFVVFFLTPCCQIFSSCLTLCIPKNCPKCQAGKWGLIKRAGNSYSYLKKNLELI